MRAIILKAFVLCSTCLLHQVTYSQLTGTALLSGQSNHSGIQVKFTAASGTAVTDSCLTSSAGTYSINISGGLYTIAFSKAGFQTILYDNGNLAALTNTVVLSTATLSPGTASYVSGNVSGTWGSQTVYHVNGNLVVPSGATLNIQPGTQLKFLGNYSLTVNGSLNAGGNAGAPIRFEPADPGTPWGSVILNGGVQTIDHCQFSKFVHITSNNARLRITNCLMTDATVAIGYSGGNVVIENNDIVNAKTFGISGKADSGAVICNRISAPLHKNGTAFNRGITVSGSDLYRDNEIWECQEGIYVLNFAVAPVFRNNYIHDNLMAMIVAAAYSPTINITNNTFHRNRTSIYNGSSDVTISNNVITSSTIALEGNFHSIDHNLFFGNGTNFKVTPPITGLGQIVNNNSNGDPIDSYYNLFIDSEYGTMRPSFQPGSPVHNAGNSTFGSQIGAVVSGTSCFASLTLGLNHKDHSTFRVYPNPSYGQFTLELGGAAKFRIYSVNGTEVLKSQTAEDSVKIDLSGRAPGIYFCEIQNQNGLTVLKLINQ